MQGKDLFEYAIVRLVPQVEREEFINIGVILYCRRQKFLDSQFELDADRINAFAGALDLELLAEYIRAFQQICSGTEPNSLIATFDDAERFRWLTAKRSSILQISAVHPGLCADASFTLNKLFEDLVKR